MRPQAFMWMTQSPQGFSHVQIVGSVHFNLKGLDKFNKTFIYFMYPH